MDSLKLLLSQNQRDRIAKEAATQNRIGDPALPRHTTYQGDRKIQQLGQETIENGVILNNQSLAIGDVVMPLAKGNVLRRVDKTNGGALLGTAYRDAVENDFDPNGNRRDSALSRNGGNEPSTPVNPISINPSTHPIFSPPFGCTPPPPKCFWTTNPTPPDGFQSHGSAVVNENAVPLYLHCTIGSAVPKNLNCSFLDPQKWSCSGGVCSPDENGIYNSQAECEAALIPANFTGGQCVGIQYRVEIRGVLYYNDGTGRTLPFASFTWAVPGENPISYVEPYGAITAIDPFRSDLPAPPATLPSEYNNGCNVKGKNSVGADANFVLFVAGFTSTQYITITETRITRLDGLPDNCGNPPPTCPP